MQIILERKDLRVQEVKVQHSIKNLQGRSIRLDIYAVDSDGKRYNIEIQRDDRGAGAKRARYNGSLMAANIANPGEECEDLPEIYVIFITERDVLEGNLPIYHVDSMIRENNQRFPDETHIIYVNSKITDETELGKLMDDFHCTEADEMNHPVLAKRVKFFKENPEGVRTMCKELEKMCEEVREETLKNNIRNMLLDHVPHDKIKQYTNATDEEIEAVEKELLVKNK